MDITGKITHALEVRSGQSARTGNNWMMQTFVIETHDQYPRRCAFEVFGEDRLKEFDIKVGEELTVSFDIDAREYQGKWYNSVRAWRVVRVDPSQAPAAGIPSAAPAMPAGAPAPAPAPSVGAGDDLPF